MNINSVKVAQKRIKKQIKTEEKMKANIIIAILLIVICSLGVYICVKEFIGEDRSQIENNEE